MRPNRTRVFTGAAMNKAGNEHDLDSVTCASYGPVLYRACHQRGEHRSRLADGTQRFDPVSVTRANEATPDPQVLLERLRVT
jgi:hypothetical protein